MKDFPIVGIGASAGGLEAYKNVLRFLPTDTGAAFILIQHLDPNHESMMADLLARHTKMKVLQAEDAMSLEPNTVYVIPPGKFIKLVDHGLFLDDPVHEHGIRLSVDYFFRSLAEARGEKSIGIVLSGTGSDGTLGIREIKAAGGMVMVQDPEEADHDGMPRSAIATGAVDFVVPASEIGESLATFLRHPYLERGAGSGLSDQAPNHFNQVLALLRQHTKYDFRSYKKGTVDRRIQRRMGLRQIKEVGGYVDLLRQSPDELNMLFRDLLIGVTRFFREPDAWKALGDEVIDPLIARRPKGAPIRCWVPGCASGEEAYTLAILLHERLARQNAKADVQIFATDLNDRAIKMARTGRYSSAIAGDVPEDLLKRYFSEEDETYRVNKLLRETVVFATQNVISDPPFSKLDIITCRNLMIYLEADVQLRMIEMFHFALDDGGHLFLGNSENAERPGRLFSAVDKPNRIYKRSDVPRARPGSFPIVPSDRARRGTAAAGTDLAAIGSATEASRRKLLERFVPAAVIVEPSFDVRYFHGPLRDYLDIPVGEPTSNVLELALPVLRTKLRTVVNAVMAEKAKREVVVHKVPRNGHEVSVRIRAETMSPGDDDNGVLVYFEDVSEPEDAAAKERAREDARANATPQEKDHVASLEYELHSTREDLQSTIEEMETSNEELKASNEEVMSMNEELQSTNEELETSREELQSLNEELSTVNSQLEDKIEELEAANNDLTNLLVSTDIGVIFLDTNLLIRRFTPAIKEIMRIIDTDLGRPVEDIAMRAQDTALIEDVRRCVERLAESEAEVDTADGRHLMRRVRPYRTSENRIEGVVVTYTDVTTLRDARDRARAREQQQEAVAELGREALAGISLDKLMDLALADTVTHLGVRFAKVLELDPDKQHLSLRAGIGWEDGLVGSAKVDAGIKSQAGYTLERSSPVIVRDFREEKRFSAPRLLKDHHILCGASVIIGPVATPWGVLGVHESDPARCTFDTEDLNYLQAVANVLWLAISREKAVAEIERERRQLRDLTDALPIEFAVVDAEGRCELVNRAFEAWAGPVEAIEGKQVSELMSAATYEQIRAPFEATLRGETRKYELVLDEIQEDGPRTVLVSNVPRIAENGDVTGVYTASVDITEQKRLEQDVLERTNQYQKLGDSIPFGVWITDPSGKLTYVSQSFLDMVGMPYEEARDFGWTSRLEEGTAADTLAAWKACLESGSNWEREHRFVGADGNVHHVLALGRPIRNESGEITSWAGLNLDITKRKKEEERQSVVSAELDHRVKNILATVGTISRLTGRSARSLQDYRTALEARIQAMANAHNMLAETGWRGTSIRRLVETELAPYATRYKDAIRIEGPDLLLAPSFAQTMALMFHELTTNAAKYGALAGENGTLAVRWTFTDELRVEWFEDGLQEIGEPEATGFGTTLMKRILKAQNVSSDLRYLETGVHATFRCKPGVVVTA